MIRYFSGVVLLQIVTLALFWASLGSEFDEILIRSVLPAALIALVTGFWFSSIARSDGERLRADMIERHAAEKEKLLQTAEKSRTDILNKANVDRESIVVQASTEREQLLRQAHKDLLRHEKSVSRRANFKVGLAFAATTAAGVLLLITELLTLGLLTITSAGGALGGYLFRWKQTRDLPRLINPDTGRVVGVNQTPSKGEVIEVLPAPTDTSDRSG